MDAIESALTGKDNTLLRAHLAQRFKPTKESVAEDLGRIMQNGAV